LSAKQVSAQIKTTSHVFQDEEKNFYTSGGTCKASLKGKRWCLKCRFEKCLRVGMDPKKNTSSRTDVKHLKKKRKERFVIWISDFDARYCKIMVLVPTFARLRVIPYLK